VRIRVNGDPVELPAELTILQLLEQLHIDPRLVAVEHNLSIIKRARYESTLIGDGDQIEIVNFVGGGQSGARRFGGSGVREFERGNAGRTCGPANREPVNGEPANRTEN
jgi:thiamine biosynthesis protein ThiS